MISSSSGVKTLRFQPLIFRGVARLIIAQQKTTVLSPKRAAAATSVAKSSPTCHHLEVSETLVLAFFGKWITSWVVEPTHLKNMLVKLGIFSKIGVNIKQIWNHHLDNEHDVVIKSSVQLNCLTKPTTSLKHVENTNGNYWWQCGKNKHAPYFELLANFGNKSQSSGKLDVNCRKFVAKSEKWWMSCVLHDG